MSPCLESESAYADLREFFDDAREYVAQMVSALDGQTAEVECKREKIMARLVHHKRIGLILPIQWLCGSFGLSRLETDLLLIFLVHFYGKPSRSESSQVSSPEVGRGPELPALLSLAHALQLAQSGSGGDEVHGFWLRQSPLVRWQLLRFEEDSRIPPLHRATSLEPRIAEYLMGDTQLDPGLGAQTRLLQRSASEPDLPAGVHAELQNLASKWAQIGEEAPILFFQGPRGCAQEEAAAFFSTLVNRQLIQVELADFSEAEPLLRQLVRESLLLQAGIYLRVRDARRDETRAARLTASLREYQQLVTLLILEEDGAPPPELDHVAICFERPESERRQRLWRECLPEVEAHVELVSRFPLTQLQIRTAARQFRRRALLAGNERRTGLEELLGACREQFDKGLEELAVKIKSPANWEDLILPEEMIQQLREIPLHVAKRDFLYQNWGFERKIHHGRGVNVLFSGVSGTGKTLSASVIANTLGMELYRIELAGVVSKYIGETEKNLDRIFAKGAASGSILFFDEADALFGKRSGISNSNDRYANLETGYLLQKMESYEGMTILATNLSGNMDEAFRRRMQFIVHFPFPKKEQRERIFRSLIPSEVPLASDLNFEFLAEKLEVTGGTIKNLVLAACFLAAGEGGEVGMRHFLHAVKREWQKVERPFYSQDFAPYENLM